MPEYFFNESESDLSGARILTDLSIGPGLQLDFALAAGAGLAVVEDFLTPPPLPGRTNWEAGQWVLTLEVVSGASVSFTAQLWRAGSSGASLIEQIGSQPAVQTGAGQKSFSFTGLLQQAGKTDRLVLRLMARNDDGSNAKTFSVRMGASRLATPLSAATRSFDPDRRSKKSNFFGSHPRPGEPVPDEDGFVENEE